jgi:hypothetical protein
MKDIKEYNHKEIEKKHTKGGSPKGSIT